MQSTSFAIEWGRILGKEFGREAADLGNKSLRYGKFFSKAFRADLCDENSSYQL